MFRTIGGAMFRLVMSGTLLVLHLYLGVRIYFMLKPYLQPVWPLFVLCLLVLYGAVYFYFTTRSSLLSEPAALYSQIGSFWLGASLVLFNFLMLYEVIRLLQRLAGITYRPLLGVSILVLALLAIVYSFLQANHIQVKHYDIVIEKSAAVKELRTVLISDLHIGAPYDPSEIEKIIDQLNRQEADLLIMAGDLFDHGLEKGIDLNHLQDQFLRLKSRYGIYAVFGNHDVYRSERLPVIEFLHQSGIQVLEDSVAEVQGIQLVGRADYFEQSQLPHVDLDAKRPIFVLDHQPKRYAEASALGADAVFSGHTHGGQIFPGNLMVAWVHDNGYGYRMVDAMHTFVSSGLRYWVTPLRFGSDSEIMVIDMHFKKSTDRGIMNLPKNSFMI